MSPLAQWTLYGFMACWAVAVAAWFHSTFYFMKWWLARVGGRTPSPEALRKSAPGVMVFLSAIGLGFLIGWIGQTFGGGWR
jgi:hypothetical protein